MSFPTRNRPSVEERPITTGFLALWLFIACVSVHDAYLLVLYRDTIDIAERNPICSFLIELNDGGIGLLLAAKALGTALVCTLLLLLVRNNPRWGWIVAQGVAAFQLCLLLYLSLA